MIDVEGIYFAVSDENRRKLLALLAQHGSLTVGELVGLRLLPQPTISRQLAVLRAAGLVTRRKSGTGRIYTLVPGALDGVVAELTELKHAAVMDGTE
ncbi:ArsR/SmtB family transcription factor [Pseudarthrobacter sp. S3]|uniref:ArsR/SmtB family transcription factor n=1 Tax=Pseudarthrobacter sp. S3 TaxID=3418419 RepID=UPI003CFA3E74